MLGGRDAASSDECKSRGPLMDTHSGEEEEEEATVNRNRCNLGFQGLAQKTHPDQPQRSWSSCLAGRCGAGGPLRVTQLGPSGAYAVLQGSPFNNTTPA